MVSRPHLPRLPPQHLILFQDYNAFPGANHYYNSTAYPSSSSSYTNSPNQVLDPQYLARRAHQQQQQAAILASVEFTDLTNP
ncbi:MAG: hypothetical protein Q9200_007176, partial [Gallowayella weberi]